MTKRLEDKVAIVTGGNRYTASMGGQHKIRVNCVRPGQIITPRATKGGPNHVFKPAFDMFQTDKIT